MGGPPPPRLHRDQGGLPHARQGELGEEGHRPGHPGPATRQIDAIVLQLGVAEVAASKRFYVDRGFAVTKSYGRKYVEFTKLTEQQGDETAVLAATLLQRHADEVAISHGGRLVKVLGDGAMLRLPTLPAPPMRRSI